MKVAVVVLADTETHEDLARVVNAMVLARECVDANDEVALIFDGAGTRWPGELDRSDHRAHQLWSDVRGTVGGACDYCAEAFDATSSVEDASVKLLSEYHRHPSLRGLLADDFRIVTF